MKPLNLDTLRTLIEPVVTGQAYELVDVEWKTETGQQVLRVFIDAIGKNAVGLDDCANVSRELSAVLDVADIMPTRYNLEVSSPGLNRPLRKESDFQRFIGQRAKIRTRTAVDETRRNFSGTLLAVEDGRVRIDVGDRTYDLLVSDVEKANLVYEFEKGN